MKQFIIGITISFCCLACLPSFAQQQLPSQRPPSSWLPPQAAVRLAQQKQPANASVLPSQRQYPFGVKSLEGKRPVQHASLPNKDKAKLPSNSKTIKQDIIKKRKKKI